MPSMNRSPKINRNSKQYWLNLSLAGAAGQIGCVTLIIVILAVLGGLWLDSQFHTRPMFTLILLIASIPVSLVAMLYIVRLVTSKIKSGPPEEKYPENTDPESLQK
jgi:magnesium-transporting ATPase (P-type)